MTEEQIRECNIDYETGLQRFLGKKELYEKFLGKFCLDESCKNAEAALKNGDEQALYIAVHTLKGVAGNLSIVNLYEICTNFCENYKAGRKDNLHKEFEDVKTEYDRVCTILSK